MTEYTTASQAAPKGLLFIWTDIDPMFEDDFNRWYDREHMAERMAIPGFELARRFVAIEDSPRYLALYRTASLAVFTSEPYRNAFANQTEWSRRTFARMKNTLRRVAEITLHAGRGEGGFLSLFQMPKNNALPAAAALDAAAATDGVISAYVVQPDPDLSVPLAAAGSAPVTDQIVIVEGTNPDIVHVRARQLAQECNASEARVVSFQHLWSLAERGGRPGI
ncbi:MAG: hypothetical protein AB1768_05290 [Pseudomonadota bacterium]|jgi:hypothetical protein